MNYQGDQLWHHTETATSQHWRLSVTRMAVGKVPCPLVPQLLILTRTSNVNFSELWEEAMQMTS